jgi:hypothetical protein
MRHHNCSRAYPDRGPLPANGRKWGRVAFLSRTGHTNLLGNGREKGRGIKEKRVEMANQVPVGCLLFQKRAGKLPLMPRT